MRNMGIKGGGIQIVGTKGNFISNIFYENTAITGGAIHFDGISNFL